MTGSHHTSYGYSSKPEIYPNGSKKDLQLLPIFLSPRQESMNGLRAEVVCSFLYLWDKALNISLPQQLSNAPKYIFSSPFYLTFLVILSKNICLPEATASSLFLLNLNFFHKKIYSCISQVTLVKIVYHVQ